MCGFLGYISKTAIEANKIDLLSHSLLTLTHRGPDGGNSYLEENVYLGHRRLSIIDLSEQALQPFKSTLQDVYIVFNGEIYNYKELSSDLSLRTGSDTEVLLEGYLKHGISFLKRIRGIYTFAIYDRPKNEVIILRDPAGIKPLYYSLDQDSFSFASEIKALFRINRPKLSINENSIKTFIHVGYIPEPETVYNEIKAFDPGTLYLFNCSSMQLRSQKFNEYNFEISNNLSFEDNVNNSERLLKTATNRNLVADVNINIALSGGIDSSLIYAYANQVRETPGITVSQHEHEFDESIVAEIYAEHINAPHLIVPTTIDNKLELLNKLLLHFDQPYADSSFIPTYFLCKTASQYSKVLIGGDSGDEIHNGYSGFRVLPYAISLNRNRILRPLALVLLKCIRLLTKGYLKRELNKLISLIEARDINELLFNWNSWFPSNPKSYPLNPFLYDSHEVYKTFISFIPGIKYSQAITACYFKKRMQSDYLRKSEMMSMYNSLEFRVPMLDEDLVEYSLSIPYNQKSKCNTQKVILRKLHERVYPKVTSQLKKKGFSIPLDTWLGLDNLNKIKFELKREDGIVHKYIKSDYIDILFKSLTDTKMHEYCSRESAYERILILYSLQLWYVNIFNSK